jgi:hypothetical protein
MKPYPLFCLLLLALAGCASPKTDHPSTAAEAQNCGHEYQTGSNLPMKRCKVPATAAERQRKIDELREEMDALSAKPIGTGG